MERHAVPLPGEEHITGSRMLGEAFLATHHGSDGGEPPQIAAWHRSIHAAAEPLLAAAQEAGAIRGDLDVTELMTLTAAIARAGAPADSGRFMGVLYEGLVPRG